MLTLFSLRATLLGPLYCSGSAQALGGAVAKVHAQFAEVAWRRCSMIGRRTLLDTGLSAAVKAAGKSMKLSDSEREGSPHEESRGENEPERRDRIETCWRLAAMAVYACTSFRTAWRP